VASEQPINAGVPPSKPAAAPPGQQRDEPPRDRGRQPPEDGRERSVGVPIALAGLGALALGLIALAILAGSDNGGETASGPERSAASPLAYPSLATSNTTRIEGPDPAARAAAVALAAYPSVDAGPRPGAVTLVNSADWETAIAASVLTAAPVGAPPLLSSAESVPEPTSEALDALEPQGSPSTHRAQVFAIAGAAAPTGFRTRRTGATGVAGAAAIAKLRDELFDAPPTHIVVAPANGPAFAMPAAAWAARSGDPVLFTAEDRLSTPTAKALGWHRGTPVYVLGPSAAISSSVVREIAKKTGAAVRRVSGESPVENAIALARYSDGDFGWNLNDPGHGFVVARADSPLDAAAAAPLSASGTWGALLLTNRGDTLPAALRGYLLDVKPGYTTNPTRAFYNHVWVIGDQEAIDVKQQAQLNELAELTRIGGGS
jgi:hypothetical protein